MSAFRKLLHRSRNLSAREKREADLSEQVRLHLEESIAANMAAGMSPEEARRVATCDFGPVDGVMESCRDARKLGWLEDLLQDLRQGRRALRGNWQFSLAAISTLAVGIGASTALFAVIEGAVLNPFPYTNAHGIFRPQFSAISEGSGGPGGSTDRVPLHFVPEAARLPGISDAMADMGTSGSLVMEDEPTDVGLVAVSGNAFSFLGVQPVLGRILVPSDVETGSSQTGSLIVLSHEAWTTFFGGDPAVIGKTILVTIQGAGGPRPHTVIGVMPRRFQWGWTQIAGRTPTPLLGWAGLPDVLPPNRGVRLSLRLKGGVSRAAAETQIVSLFQGVVDEGIRNYQQFRPGFTARLISLPESVFSGPTRAGSMRSSLWLLFGSVGFLLLIACTNVANLQLARAASRGREIAVRLAIGASRGRLVRQLLTESAQLSLAGGALGVLLGLALLRIIRVVVPSGFLPTEAELGLNGTALLYAVAVAVFSGLLFGLAPALQSSKADVHAVLKGGRSSGSDGASGKRTRGLLVVAEIALSVVLLCAATLAVRSYISLRAIDPGFSPDNVLYANISLPISRYPAAQPQDPSAAPAKLDLARNLMERVGRLPGVESVMAGTGGLPGYWDVAPDFRVMGAVVTNSIPVAPGFPAGLPYAATTEDYLRFMKTPLRQGRMFTAEEVSSGARVVLINEAAARLWPEGVSPMGTALSLSQRLERLSSLTVIGIMADGKYAGLESGSPPVAIIPYSLNGASVLSTFVRARDKVQLGAVEKALRSELRAIDPTLALSSARNVGTEHDVQFLQPRFNLTLFASIAAVALALAAAGIFSVLTYHVEQQRRDIGVRLALGATRGDILRLVLASGGRLIVIGMLVGGFAALALNRFVRGQIVLSSGFDPVAWLAAGTLLAVVALVACLLPALRATRVDPLTALRQD